MCITYITHVYTNYLNHQCQSVRATMQAADCQPLFELILICIHIHVFIYLHAYYRNHLHHCCQNAKVYKHTCVCVYIYIYIYIYTCIYTYIYIYIYMYTYIHITNIHTYYLSPRCQNARATMHSVDCQPLVVMAPDVAGRTTVLPLQMRVRSIHIYNIWHDIHTNLWHIYIQTYICTYIR